MILIGVTFHGQKTGNISEEDDVCWTSDCIKTAADVTSNMDPTADSCTHFYNFACGKYGQEPGQTASVSTWSTDSVYFSLKKMMESEDKIDIDGLNDMKRFYNSCVEFGSYRQDVGETGASLLNLMNDMGIGIWPIIDKFYETSMFSREHTLASLTLLDVPVVFKMEIVPDKNLPGSHLIKISPGGPRESGRSPSDIRSDVHLRYRVLTSILLLGATTANTDVDDILSVDSSFAAIEEEKSTPCDDVTVLAPQEAISELNRLMPEIDWNIIISDIQNATGLRRTFAVELHCKQKIRDYVVHLYDLSVKSETNYLGWRFFSKFVEHVIPTFEKSKFGSEEVVPRWRICLEQLEKFASPLLADLLTQETLNEDIQKEVERISDTALAVTQELVSGTRWLNDSQRSRIREKVARIRMRYPFQKQDTNGLRPVRIPRVDVSNFTAVVIQRQRQWIIEKFQRLSPESESAITPKPWTPVLTARSGSQTADYTAYVYFDKIRNPYIRLHGSKWLNYGGFGISVAREISKVLMWMSFGKIEDEGNALWNIWSRSASSSACISKSFAARLKNSKEGVSSQVWEKLMQDAFLDHSSLEIAYETALSLANSESHSLPGLELSNEKMFFLSYAQTLCDSDSSSQSSKNIPVSERLNAAVSSFKPFTDVYSCASAPSQCQIWP